MRYLLFSHREARRAAEVEDVRGALSAAAECELIWIEDGGDIDRSLLGDQEAIPVIAGGDGSIHHFVNRLAGLDQLERAVGIIPLGTGNDLARGVELPLEPSRAAARIITGAPHRLTLLEAPTGELGVNNAHAGMGVAAARRGDAWKQRLGPVAYTAGSLAEGAAYRGSDAQVEVDGERVFAGRALVVMVMVGPSSGGGMQPLKGVDPEDPVLDVLVVGAGGGGFDRLGLAWAALRGELASRRDVTRSVGREVRVESAETVWEIDGEFREWTSPVELRVSEQRWLVIA